MRKKSETKKSSLLTWIYHLYIGLNEQYGTYGIFGSYTLINDP